MRRKREGGTMTEAEWQECSEATVLLNFLRGKGSDRKWRLYACGCCRAAWHLLTDQQSRRAVEVAETFAEGGGSRQALAEAHRQAVSVVQRETMLAGQMAARAAVAASHDWQGSSGCEMAIRAARALQARGYGAIACSLVHDVFGNPYHPLPAAPTWMTPEVRTLAADEAIRGGFFAGPLDPVRLAVLGDALEEAGCTNTEILDHLRGPGPHVRGCFVLDLLLGKE
jgi:hypothetical protein